MYLVLTTSVYLGYRRGLLELKLRNSLSNLSRCMHACVDKSKFCPCRYSYCLLFDLVI